MPDYDYLQLVQIFDENHLTLDVVYQGQTTRISPSDLTHGSHVYLFMRTQPPDYGEDCMTVMRARQDCTPAGMLTSVPGSSDPSDPYAAFAPFYDWLADDEVMSGEPFWNRFGDSLTTLPSGARVLDCACGTGYNALALTHHGFIVSGSDASQAMLTEASRRLPEHVNLRHCEWSELPGAFAERFDAVVCTGNSLMHAGDEHSMVAALTGISGVLKPGGLLLLDSRNWEKLREERPLLQVPRPPMFRNGQAAVAVYTWHWPDDWNADHRVEIAVIGTDGDRTTLGRTHITYRPFTFEDLTERLSRVGFETFSHTFSTETYVYEVNARLVPGTAATSHHG